MQQYESQPCRRPRVLPSGVGKPCAACGAHLGDVTRGREWSFGVAEEGDSLGFEVCDGGLDVVDFEVREGVDGVECRAFEDRQLTLLAAARPDGDWILPELGEAEDLAVEVLRLLQVADRDGSDDHGGREHGVPPGTRSFGSVSRVLSGVM